MAKPDPEDQPERVDDPDAPIFTCPACGRTLVKLERRISMGYCSRHGKTVARKLANGLASMKPLWVADLPKERP